MSYYAHSALTVFIFIAPVPIKNKVLVSSGRRKQQKVVEPMVVSDEESVEDESVTRCVCGESRKFYNLYCLFFIKHILKEPLFR